MKYSDTLKDAFSKALQSNGEDWNDVESTTRALWTMETELPPGPIGHFFCIVWTKNRVYFTHAESPDCILHVARSRDSTGYGAGSIRIHRGQPDALKATG